jgi:copper homeostasis protein
MPRLPSNPSNVVQEGRPSNPRLLVEICAGDVTSAWEAQSGGADRVELCDNLAVGGTTPCAGTIGETCRVLSIPVHVLIRPRAGDFIYSDLELGVMRRDIAVAKDLGASGVVLGVLTRERAIDRVQTAALLALARPMRVTFHKAFDQTRDPLVALETLVALGVDCVLTSGGRSTALAGVETLASLVRRSRDRIMVMAGGRLNSGNLETVIRRSRVGAVHLGSGVSRTVEGAMAGQSGESSDMSWSQVDAGRVGALRALLESVLDDVQNPHNGPDA